MKHWISFLIATVLLITGCEYEAPLTEECVLDIDSSVLGHWEEVPDDGKQPGPDQMMMILKYSKTEYLIHYPTSKNGFYFRGYPINVGGVPCVQIQLIGTSEGDIKKDERDFHAVSYKRSKDELTVKILNKSLVDPSLESSSDLKKAFLKHKDKADLFISPGKFRKVNKKS